jgi:predicted RNA binding protein YcfA (HicA-like mRNA interferase family)
VVIKALAKKGFRVAGQKGSHIFLTDGKHKLTVPAMTHQKGDAFINHTTGRIIEE